MDTSVAKFPFVQLMDNDLEEPKFASRITDRINSLMEVGRWHHMDEISQITLDDIVADAVKEMHLHCIRENLRLDCLEVALYDPVNDVPATLPNEIIIPGNRPWIKLLCIVNGNERVTEMATCKFYKQDGIWVYKIRPGFDDAAPVNEHTLLRAFGVQSRYEVIVVVPRGNETIDKYNVKIKDNKIVEVELEGFSSVPSDVEEFVVRLDGTAEGKNIPPVERHW